MPKIESFNLIEKADKFAQEGYPQLGLELLNVYSQARQQALLEITAAWDRFNKGSSHLQTDPNLSQVKEHE